MATRGSARAPGQRPDLVLVHGLGSDHRYWENILPDLAADFGVTAVDLPGHGIGATRLTAAQAHPQELAAAVVSGLADQGIERPHVVGLSLGGWVALEMGAMGAAASVTALAPAGLWAPGAHIRREREEPVLARGLRLLNPALPRLTRLTVVKRIGLRVNVADPGAVGADQFLGAARALMHARAYAACDKALVRGRFEHGHRITVPVSVAFGDGDRVLPPHSSQDPSGLPAQATWTVVPRCGHAMTWDQPAICTQLIRDTTGRGASVTPAR